MKKRLIIVLSFLIFLLIISVVNAVDANSTTCGTVNSSLTITANINASGTCFLINGSNININGGGFNILGNTSGYGIDNSGGFNNITIRNFGLIRNFSNGIYFYNSKNSTIYNNSIESARINN